MNMKRYIAYIITIITALTITSCNVLDVDPVDSFTDAAVWSELALAEAYLNSSYTRIKPESEKGSRYASLSEEVYQMHTYGTENVRQGYLSNDNSSFGWEQDMWNPWHYWYRSIKEINIFLGNIDEVPTPNAGDDKWKERLKGQGYFLRAYFYNQLFSLFGRIPLIDKVHALDTEEFNEERESIEAVAEFIVEDCDKAIELLPTAYDSEDDYGRATKGAAMMVKGRTLLFAASKLYDSNYPTKAKWEKAAAAHKDIIDLGIYSLSTINNSDDYADLFLDSQNPEIIFLKQYDAKYVAGSNSTFLHQAPCGTGNGFEGWGTLQPTQNIVDKFQMNDGSDYVRGAVDEYPWANRDVRLHATILLDGQEWGYGESSRKVEFFVAGEKDAPKGRDSREGANWWNGTLTGYQMRKFLNPKWDAYGTNANQAPWIYMRLSEVYLNYAECLIELGKDSEALTYINEVRERALQPAAEGVDIWAEYEYERQIELVFEGQRWFDTRRWMTTEDVYKEPIYGMLIKKYKDESLTYEIKAEPIETRKFYAPKNYWMPIPRSELRKAPQIDARPYE